MPMILICDADENPLETNSDNIRVNKIILNPASTIGDLRKFLAKTYRDENFNTYDLTYYVCFPQSNSDPQTEKLNGYFDLIPNNETPLSELVLQEKNKIRQNFVFVKHQPEIVIAITDPRFKPKKTAMTQADATPQATSSSVTVQAPTASSVTKQPVSSVAVTRVTPAKEVAAAPEKTQAEQLYEQYKGKRFAELPIDLQKSIKNENNPTNRLIKEWGYEYGLEAFWNAENHGNKGSRQVEGAAPFSYSPLLLKEIQACPALLASTAQSQSSSSSRGYSR